MELARFRATGAAVVAIAGNNDWHVLVAIHDPLLAGFGVTVRETCGGPATPFW